MSDDRTSCMAHAHPAFMIITTVASDRIPADRGIERGKDVLLTG
jgi:hypothetical protein